LPNGYVYTTLAGDTWDSIALDFYNDESLTQPIILANLKYRDVIIFQGGENIQVPIIEQQSATTLPPWKRS
jgi:hypothetical protein